MAKKRTKKAASKKNGNGANLGFEATMWQAAPRGSFRKHAIGPRNSADG